MDGQAPENPQSESPTPEKIITKRIYIITPKDDENNHTRSPQPNGLIEKLRDKLRTTIKNGDTIERKRRQIFKMKTKLMKELHKDSSPSTAK